MTFTFRFIESCFELAMCFGASNIFWVLISIDGIEYSEIKNVDFHQTLAPCPKALANFLRPKVLANFCQIMMLSD